MPRVLHYLQLTALDAAPFVLLLAYTCVNTYENAGARALADALPLSRVGELGLAAARLAESSSERAAP